MLSLFHPLVSIVIPVYNGANYLREAIDSALAQTYDNIEIIVVNDGSKDEGATEAIALSYGDKIRYFSKENGGVATALNFGIAQMKGEYFSWLAHDDWLVEDKISQLVYHLSCNDNSLKKIIVSGYENYSETQKKNLHDAQVFCLSTLFEIFSNMFTPNLNISTFFIPKSVFDKVGYFDEKALTVQDYDFIFRMIKKGYSFEFLDKPLTVRRIHDAQGTATMLTTHVKELEFLYLKYIKVFLKQIAEFALVEIEVLHSAMLQRGLIESARRLSGIVQWKRLSLQCHSDVKTFLWLYWENKPETLPPALVLDCWKSISTKCREEFTIINLDDVTIALFIEYINPKVWLFEQIAHRADYFRFKLLEAYGGIWLDSDNMVLNSLTEVARKINQYDFVCTGYTESNYFFPIISFLGCQKNSSVCKSMIANFESFFIKNNNEFSQPEWDQLGGHALSKILDNQQNKYIYPVEKFYPVPTWHSPQLLFMQPSQETAEAIEKAFCQAISYSVVKDVYDFFNNSPFKEQLAIGVLCNDKCFEHYETEKKARLSVFTKRIHLNLQKCKNCYHTHGFSATLGKVVRKCLKKIKTGNIIGGQL